MGITGKRKQKIVLTTVIVGIILLAFGAYRLTRRQEGPSLNTSSTFVVQRGDLVMSVTESGTIKARNAVEIKSQVEGSTTIVSLVPEGSYVTEQDVEDGKVLVELDSSDLRDNMNQQEISFNSAEADYTEAKESLTIQKIQNDSDIQGGLLDVKFARMDLQKYLGGHLADTLVEEYQMTGKVPVADTLLSEPNLLGGSSLQELRRLESEIDLAEEDYKRAETDLGWTQKLYDKQYVALSDLKTDQLKVKRLKVNWERMKTSLSLFLKYDFPKETERLFSGFLEAERDLEQIYAQTRSRLAQAEARLNSSEAKYLLNKERLERTRKQIEACIVTATEPGLVIYASSNRRWGGSRTNIEVGESIRERELIMTITNAEEMDVDVKVHETNVDKVHVDQPVKIVIDAQPDKVFTGKVVKIAPLPDPQSFFGNPDLKVYTTDVTLEGVGDSIKPGMSARVEILIAELKNVLSIPVQCVANRSGRKVCFVLNNGKPTERVIQAGAFNDRFIQILDGLEKGEIVLLNPPRLLTSSSDKNQIQGESADTKDKRDSELSPAQEVQQPPQTDEQPTGGAEGGTRDRFKEMDKNGDGKISLTDEVPEQAKQFMQPLDTDKDGFLTKEEMAAARKKTEGQMRGGGGQRGSRQRPEGSQGPQQ